MSIFDDTIRNPARSVALIWRDVEINAQIQTQILSNTDAFLLDTMSGLKWAEQSAMTLRQKVEQNTQRLQ